MTNDILKTRRDALEIWQGGACNQRAIARALVNAIDCGSEAAARVIIAHLCFLMHTSMNGLGGYGDEAAHDVMRDVDDLEALVRGASAPVAAVA